MTLVALDGKAIREDGRGTTRVMRQLIPLLSCLPGLEYISLVTEEGNRLLGPSGGDRLVVPTMPNSVWEQFGLPWYARRAGAAMIFSSAECAALWGPRVLLHVPEDPRVRWRLMPATTRRERVRRIYQTITMGQGIRRAPAILASCRPTAQALQNRFGSRIRTMEVVPLGVDPHMFFPSPGRPKDRWVFHLGSVEARDESSQVVLAYAQALGQTAGLPDLVIGGDLGPNLAMVHETARQAGIAGRVHVIGRVPDAELRRRYADAAICVQLTRYEGFGLQPLEALSCGAPLIASSDAALREVVGDAAVLVENNSPSAVGGAIAELWSNPDLRARLRAAGPRRAERYPWGRMAASIHATLLGLTLGTRSPTSLVS